MLTAVQLKAMTFIVDYALAHNGVPPSCEEIRCGLDLKSKSGVQRLIERLEERGFVRREPHKARGLEVLRVPFEITKAITANMFPDQMRALAAELIREADAREGKSGVRA